MLDFYITDLKYFKWSSEVLKALKKNGQRTSVISPMYPTPPSETGLLQKYNTDHSVCSPDWVLYVYTA